jgi:hypothetical protein
MPDSTYAAHQENTLGSPEPENTRFIVVGRDMGQVSPYDIRKIGRKSEPASQHGLT